MRGGRTVTADSVTESAWRRNLSSSTEYYCAAAVAFKLLDLPATDYCHEFAGESESVAGAADSGGVEGGSPPLAGVRRSESAPGPGYLRAGIGGT